MKSNEWAFRKVRMYLNVFSFENLAVLFIKSEFKDLFKFFEVRSDYIRD